MWRVWCWQTCNAVLVNKETVCDNPLWICLAEDSVQMTSLKGVGVGVTANSGHSLVLLSGY